MKLLRNLLAAGALTIAPLLSPATEQDIRTRMEFTDSGAVQTQKYTLGVSPADKGKYAEWFRAYVTESQTENVINPSVRTNFNDLELTLFGETGKKDGLGTQVIYDLTGKGAMKPSINFENERINGKAVTRKGFGIESKIDKLTLNAGFDNFTGTSRNITRVSAVYDIDSQNAVGLDYSFTNGTTGATHTLIGSAVSYGPKKDLGFRTYFKGAHTEGAKKDALEFDLLIAQHPKFGRVSGAAIIGRGVDRFYDVGTLKSPVSLIERTPLGERSKKGLAAQFDLIANRNDYLPTTGSARLEAGYAIPLNHNDNGNYVCPTVFGKKLLGTSKPNIKGTSAQLKLGNLLLEANRDSSHCWYASVQYTPRWK